MQPLKIFIGFDQAEAVAYHTLCHSILSRASVPVSITPVKQSLLRDIYDRPRDPRQSNEFSFTRFLVPYLSNYQGWSLFMDCDMLVLADIKELFDRADDQYAVMCVQHDYEPNDTVKYLGNQQLPYEKKNWSSVMLFNNAQCRALTPYYINRASGLELHQFKWLDGDHKIGALPREWNHLVGEYKRLPYPKIVHWTVGGPWFEKYAHTDYAFEWYEERALMGFAEEDLPTQSHKLLGLER